VLLAMPCSVAEPPALGAKIVSVFRDNPARGLPTVTSIYVLSDYTTGEPLALMDGGYLTGIRTAAGSAVATRALARPEASTLGVFGTGVQARFHVETIRRVCSLNRVLVAATSPEKAERFAAWVTSTTRLSASAASIEDVSAADIIATCTTNPSPVVEASAVRGGAHINAVGAFTPSTRELPSSVVERASVYVDTRPGAFSEAGDLLLARDETSFRLEDVRGEVGEVLLGSVAGRTDSNEVTIYKSVGAAFLDAATARLAYEAATRNEVGTVYEFQAE
jgi:ornithine cyclodeaminase